MADESFDGLALAVSLQDPGGSDSGFGDPDTTLRALSGTIDETDGCVLGDKNSGDAESGISSPELVGIYREVADVAASFTPSADSLQKIAANGFAISFPVQGNGDTATPSPGDASMATLFPGYHALYNGMGLVGANGGANAEYDYTPAHAGSTYGATKYLSCKVWVGDLSFFFSDCLVESADFVCTPGGNVICTANISVGTIDTDYLLDGVTFPTITYDAMASNAAPVVEGVAFAAFGQTRGFENLTVSIANSVDEYGDSNVDTTGTRYDQTKRVISVNGTLYVNTSDSDAALANLKSTSAPTDDLSFQVGTAATGATVLNAFKISVNNLQAKGIKYNRLGSVLAVELNDSKATATAAGAEFELQFN